MRPRIDTPHTHGTGCTLSAAIAALLARGASLTEAVDRAKAFVWHGTEARPRAGGRHGRGPVDHLYALRRAASAGRQPEALVDWRGARNTLIAFRAIAAKML